MTTFRIFYTITGSAYADIEAETLEEAEKQAQEMPGEDFIETDDREWNLDIEFNKTYNQEQGKL